MPRVRNHRTGMVHEVPVGHPALTDGQHDVLEDEAETVEATNATDNVEETEDTLDGPVEPDGNDAGHPALTDGQPSEAVVPTPRARVKRQK